MYRITSALLLGHSDSQEVYTASVSIMGTRIPDAIRHHSRKHYFIVYLSTLDVQFIQPLIAAGLPFNVCIRRSRLDRPEV